MIRWTANVRFSPRRSSYPERKPPTSEAPIPRSVRTAGGAVASLGRASVESAAPTARPMAAATHTVCAHRCTGYSPRRRMANHAMSAATNATAPSTPVEPSSQPEPCSELAESVKANAIGPPTSSRCGMARMMRNAVVSRFRHPERQREEIHFENWFRAQGYDVVLLERGLFFEGAGDLLGFPDTWFGGYRQRSDIRAYPVLSEVFQREIIPVELVDSRFYHLDTCFCPLSGGELLYYPPAFDPYAQAAIAERIPAHRRLIVPESDSLKFACNAVCIGKHVVLPTGCETTEELLRERGYLPHPTALDEFLKSGGSAKCLTLALD